MLIYGRQNKMNRLMFMYKYAKPGIHFDEDKEVNRAFSKVKNVGDVYALQDEFNTMIDKDMSSDHKVPTKVARALSEMPYVRAIHSRLPYLDSLDEEGLENVIEKMHKADHRVPTEFFYHPSMTDGLRKHILQSDKYPEYMHMGILNTSEDNPNIHDFALSHKNPKIRALAVYNHPAISTEKLNEIASNDPDDSVRFEAEERLKHRKDAEERFNQKK